MTEKEISQLAQKYLSAKKRNDEFCKKEDKFWSEENRLEKLLQKELRKGITLPKTRSIKVGDYRISCSIRFGYGVKVKKIK